MPIKLTNEMKKVENEAITVISARDHEKRHPVDLNLDLDPVMMDDLWAKELSQLGVDERESNDDHINGIRSLAIDENPDKLHQALNEMQDEINNLPEEDKRNHVRGLEMGSMYIQSLAFRLKFLRSLQFEPKAAAIRYCNCLDLLSELFGDSALMRRLYITDLNQEEINYMKEGQYQVLPSRDRLGRRVVVFNMRATKRTYSSDIMFKVYIWIMHAILSEDISTQKHGMVYIGVLSLNQEMINQTMNSTGNLHTVHKMYAGTPLFWGGVHVCLPDDRLYRILTALIMAGLGKGGRKLLRIHRGNPTEYCYALRSYGIPVGDFPQMHTGQIKTKNFLRMIKVRSIKDEWQAKEEKLSKKRSRRRKTAPEAIKPFPGIECPEINFVILVNPKADFGQHATHPGNIEFRKIMTQNDGFKRYLSHHDDEGFGGRSEVMNVVDDVLQDVVVRHLHFSMYDTEKGYYTEIVNEEDLRKKVELIMRRHRTRFWAEKRLKSAKDNDKPSSRTSSQKQALDLSEENRKDCSSGGCL